MNEILLILCLLGFESHSAVRSELKSIFHSLKMSINQNSHGLKTSMSCKSTGTKNYIQSFKFSVHMEMKPNQEVVQ